MADPVAGMLPGLISDDPAARNEATLALRAMETQPGFSAHLLQLAASRELPPRDRWVAVLYLKNQVARFWQRRSGVPFEIAAAEKAVLRAGILNVSLDEDDNIAVQSAVVVAKIARADYPNAWPEIVQQVTQAAEQCAAAEGEAAMGNLLRVLRVLNLVIKELSSKRLVADRRAFLSLAPPLLPLLARLITSFSTSFCAALEPTADASVSVLTGPARGGLCLVLKTLRRVLVQGFQQLHRAPEASAQLATVVALFKHLLAKLLSGTLPPAAATHAERCCHFAGKTILFAIEKQAAAVSPHVRDILGIVPHYASPLPPSLQATLLRLLSALLASPFSGKMRAGPEHSEGCAALAEHLHDTLAGTRLQDVIVKCLLMDADEAEEVLECDGLEAGEDGTVRDAAVSCTRALLETRGEAGLPALLHLLETSTAQDEKGAMVRGACFHALALAPRAVLQGGERAVQQILGLAERELSSPGGHAPLPQWRAIRAIGAVAHELGKKEEEDEVEGARGAVVAWLYKVLADEGGRHVAVTLAAAAAIAGEEAGGGDEEDLEDDDEEEEEVRLLLPDAAAPDQILALASGAAARIAGGAQTREGKQAAVRLLKVVAKSVPSAREPSLHDDLPTAGTARRFPILPSIGALWVAVAGDRHMQEQVVRVMIDVLDTSDLNGDSAALSLIVGQVVSEVLAEGGSSMVKLMVKSAPSVVLLETTAELWFQLLHAVPALTEPLANLMPRVTECLLIPGGPAETLLKIAEAYVLLGASQPSGEWLQWLSALLERIGERCAAFSLKELRAALAVFEASIAIAGDDVWVAGGPLLVTAGALVLHGRGTPGPALPASWAAGVAAICCRTGDGGKVGAIVAGIPGATQEGVLDAWVDAWESLVSIERRRATSLALVRLIAAGFPPAVAHLPSLANMVVEISAEEAGWEHEAAARDARGGSLSAVQRRRRALWLECYQGASPAAMLRAALDACRAKGGGAAVDAALALTDATIMTQLSSLA